MAAPPPKTIHLLESLDALTVRLPARADALTAHVLHRLGLAGLASAVLVLPFLSVVLGPIEDRLAGLLHLALLVLVTSGSLGIWRSVRALQERLRPELHITPQQVRLRERTLLLEEVERVVLELERGRLRLEAAAGPPLVLPVELDYAELVWLRALLEDAVLQRRRALGIAAPGERTVPEDLSRLLQR